MYNCNFKLAGFDSSIGIEFIDSYNEENSLDLSLTNAEKEQLINFAQGNTLVLVLSLRRLSKKLASVEGLRTECSSANAWKSLKSSLATTPSNTYEVVAQNISDKKVGGVNEKPPAFFFGQNIR